VVKEGEGAQGAFAVFLCEVGASNCPMDWGEPPGYLASLDVVMDRLWHNLES
jgi:hypothetical protein